jgi:sulfite exporter TauE/SafE
MRPLPLERAFSFILLPSMNEPIIATLGLGFVLGLKHATEADHLAAVSAIVTEKRSLWQSAAVGALWGAGQTASLFVAGVFVILLGIAIPERVANVLELAVALMIVFLGARLLRHAPTMSSTHMHSHKSFSGWRPVLIGIVHGLAGSAALTLLVLAEVVRNGMPALGFAYLLVFGIGSIGGMLVMSSLIGLPISLGARFFQRTLLPMRVFVGILSTSFGVVYALRIMGRLST